VHLTGGWLLAALASLETVLEPDHCTVIERDRVNVCVVRRQAFGADVKQPLLVGSVPVKSSVT